MKTRPPATAGWPHMISAPGKPNAHFSLRCETWSAAKPAALAGWKRVFETSGLQPLHKGAPEMLPRPELLPGELRLLHWLGIKDASASLPTSGFRPPR